jgi:hypothetical protein
MRRYVLGLMLLVVNTPPSYADPTADARAALALATAQQVKLNALEQRVTVLEGKKATATPVKNVQIGGVWFTKLSDGNYKWCEECNGKPDPYASTVAATPGVVAASPFIEQWQQLLPRQSYTTQPIVAPIVGTVNTPFPVIYPTGSTRTLAPTAVRRGGISNLFRGGPSGCGGLP